MKILRKLCSQQVQILLERMDDHWAEEFAIEGSKWEPMLPHGGAFEQFTKIEQKCIRATAREQTTKLKKERAYAGILERTMSPTKTRWEFQDEKYGRSEHVGVVAQERGPITAAMMKQQAQSLLEKEYAKAYGQQAVDRQAQQAQMLGDYMRNVQFELNQARSQEEMDMIMQRQQYIMAHEKAAIEQHKYLQQHAPRGYL